MLPWLSEIREMLREINQLLLVTDEPGPWHELDGVGATPNPPVWAGVPVEVLLAAGE